MKFVVSYLLFLFCVSPAVCSAGESFQIYAPSRTTESLWVVEAKLTQAKLTLSLKKQIALDFPAATIVSHPGKNLLYVSSARTGKQKTQGAVIVLDAKGDYRKHTPVTFQHGYSYLSLDRENRYLLGCNYFDGFVDVYELNQEGIPHQRVSGLNEGRRNAHCVLPSPNNRFVYIPYVKETNALFQYRFDANSGKLTALEPKNAIPPQGTGPRHMAYHPKKPIAYFSNEQHLGVSVYGIEPSGQLKLRQVCDAFPAGTNKNGLSSSDILLTPDGQYLFAGIRGHQQEIDGLTRYRILPDGTLKLLGLTPTEKIPWGLTLSPDGQFLLVTAFQGESLTAFRIGKDGNLSKAATLKWDKSISDLVAR